jgi:Holliday junction resolvase RusA-like endonuclease
MDGPGVSTLQFAVEGLPQPQGSITVYNGHPTSANKHLKPWRAAVVAKAWDAVANSGWPTTEGPVEVSLAFVLPRGKTVRREFPTVRPDIDKLARALLDAMTTAAVYRDDSQVIGLFVTKHYAQESQPCGVEVAVETLEDV